MWKTNLRVLAVTLLVIGFYTSVAHVIPQLQSEVPEALDASAMATPEALVAAGERVYNGAGGCAACHGLGTRAPNLLSDHAGQGAIGARCGSRPGGASCKQYLHESMIEPAKYIVPGFEAIMPDMRRSLSADQIWAVVAFLESQGGEVTVTGEDIMAAAEAPGSQATGPAVGTPALGASPPGGGTHTATLDPRALLREKGCIGCHQFEGQGAPIGPPIERMRGLTSDYVRRAILVPNADTAKGFEQFAGTMPPTFGQQLSAAQLEALVQFLESRR